MSGNLDEDQLRKNFARQLALQTFSGKKGVVKLTRKPVNAEKRALWAKASRSAKLIAGEQGHRAVLYSLFTEQARALTTMVHTVMPKIENICSIHAQDSCNDEAHFLK
jgi:hypothetical protein